MISESMTPQEYFEFEQLCDQLIINFKVSKKVSNKIATLSIRVKEQEKVIAKLNGEIAKQFEIIERLSRLQEISQLAKRDLISFILTLRQVKRIKELQEFTTELHKAALKI
jgi:uncharacterized coiled-coil protein SlyX